MDEAETARFDAEIRREEHQEVGTMIQTLSEAIQASEARGELRTARRAIILMAKECHETLPAGIEEQLNAINDLERLFKILERVPRVASLDEIMSRL